MPFKSNRNLLNANGYWMFKDGDEWRPIEMPTVADLWNTEPKDDELTTKELLNNYLNKSYNTEPKETVEIPIVNHVHSVGPALIVYWSDGSFTKAVCSKEDVWSYEIGFMVCFMKKLLGKKRFYDTLKHVNDYVKFDIDHGNVDPKFYHYSEFLRKEREVAERKRAKKAKKRREKRIREMAEAYSIALASQKNVNPMEASQKRCARRTKKEESDQ